MWGDLHKAPLITLGALGQACYCGSTAVESAATRLGITPTRMPSGRKLMSYEQALLIAAELTKNVATK